MNRTIWLYDTFNGLPHGAGLSHMVWMEPNASVVEYSPYLSYKWKPPLISVVPQKKVVRQSRNPDFFVAFFQGICMFHLFVSKIPRTVKGKMPLFYL